MSADATAPSPASAGVVRAASAIGRAGLTDLPAIWRLERACFPQDAYDLLTLFEMAVNPGLVRLKAVAGGKLVGYLAGEAQRRREAGWIITIGVLPEYQGLGIGRALLTEAEGALNVARVKLTVRRGNARAVALYEHCGYRHSSTVRGYYHDGEDGLIMEKEVW
jgi:ribosomal-protein-alanine N-acetyltransferase